MSRKYWENLEQAGGDVVPAGTYDVEVVDARGAGTQSGGEMLWLDLKVTSGPDANRVVSVSLNLPDDNASRGAKFYFGQKMRGFVHAVDMAQIAQLPDEQQTDALAEALLGTKAVAELSIQTGGTYDGSQQLDATSELVVVTAPAAAPRPAQQAADTVVTVEETEPAVAAASSGDDELPF